ncbi:hypothetical protein L2E82_27417 [Cichorium intybus]|uniref:Uncharacterized protein n=1 Tax=Cichorium intybus TaxID=13427 RepID=A0ACB9CT23_CICIN|nr:hypothetical protein L2E82_27417 [Cichorium intybus]
MPYDLAYSSPQYILLLPCSLLRICALPCVVDTLSSLPINVTTAPPQLFSSTSKYSIGFLLTPATLTQSDANNGGGFSVPRYCAETIFPKLDFTADPPVQTILAKDVMGKFGISDIFTEAVKLAANGMSEHIQRSGLRYVNSPPQGSREALRGISNLPYVRDNWGNDNYEAELIARSQADRT